MSISSIRHDFEQKEFKRHALEYFKLYTQRTVGVDSSFTWFRGLTENELVNLDYDVRLCTELQGVPSRLDFGETVEDTDDTFSCTINWSDDDKKSMTLLLQHKHFKSYDKEVIRAISTQLPFEQVFVIAHAMILVNFHITIQLERPPIFFKSIGDYLISTLRQSNYHQALLGDPFKHKRHGNVFII